MLPGQPADSMHALPQRENCQASQGKESGEKTISGSKARIRHHTIFGEEMKYKNLKWMTNGLHVEECNSSFFMFV